MDYHEENKYDYVKETIIDGRQRKKQKFKDFLLVFMALIILSSSVMFALFRFYPNREPDSMNIPTGQTGEPLKIIIEGGQEEPAESEQYEKLKATGENAGRFIVTVRAVRNEEDWVENYMEGDGVTTGIIIDIEKTIHFLTDYDTIRDSEKIMVKFQNGDSALAEITGYDENSGIAILAVRLSELQDETKLAVAEAPLKEAGGPGEPVIILGNPSGENQYMTFAHLTSTDGILITTDDMYRVLMTDAAALSRENGFIIDSAGWVIGIITPRAKLQNPGGIQAGIAMEDLLELMDWITEKKEMASLGIKGQEITDEILELAEDEMPYGIFVKSIEASSAAYAAGIAGGDIITKMDGARISTFSGFEQILAAKVPGDQIEVTIKRKVREGYEEYTYPVTLKKR